MTKAIGYMIAGICIGVGLGIALMMTINLSCYI